MSKLFVLDRNTWNHTTVYKLFVLDRNTWYHRTVCKLFVLYRNTWYPITVPRKDYQHMQFFFNAQEHWKYSYYYNQIFRN